MRATAPLPSEKPRYLYALAGLLSLTATFIVLGHDGRRVAQMLVLFLPALVWLAWPVRCPVVRRIRQPIVWAWTLLFVLDGAVRGFLLDAYNATPDSTLVLGSAANTNPRETSEYLQSSWRTILLWTVALVAAAAITWRLAGSRQGNHTFAPRGLMIAVLCVSLFVSAVGYASKPWRRLHPLAFWPGWVTSLESLRGSLADQQQWRETMLTRAHALTPSIQHVGPSTVVLVVTDSINRDNMSLYGYARATTPRLTDQARQLDEQMLTLRNAWSVDASTLPALRNIFGLGQPDAQGAQHLLALARASGYKVWWMSNHDDMAVEQQHARMADVVDFVNRTPGRASASLDGELLDCLQEALEDKTPRKLIVVHLLGAHPHYRLRFPSGQNPFDDAPDDIDAQMQKQGRATWVRRFRQDYDAALLYHDFVVSETLQLTRSVGRPEDYRAWMYLSDHGQEVGHERDQVGHSPTSESGYRIPALMWTNSPSWAADPAVAVRPFRADWAGWTLADLMHLRWTGQERSRNVLDQAYRWEAPQLPFPMLTFDR